jgi:hypothetical protein
VGPVSHENVGKQLRCPETAEHVRETRQWWEVRQHGNVTDHTRGGVRTRRWLLGILSLARIAAPPAPGARSEPGAGHFGGHGHLALRSSRRTPSSRDQTDAELFRRSCPEAAWLRRGLAVTTESPPCVPDIWRSTFPETEAARRRQAARYRSTANHVALLFDGATRQDRGGPRSIWASLRRAC